MVTKGYRGTTAQKKKSFNHCTVETFREIFTVAPFSAFILSSLDRSRA